MSDQNQPELTENVAIVVQNISRSYRSEVSGKTAKENASIREKMAHFLVRRPYYQTVQAVKNVSFVAKAGESIGVLGGNGAGKSTLLRMVAGVERPNSGIILARSQPTMLGVNAALVPDLSGYKNIQLGCFALGLTPQETRDVTPMIVEIAGLGDSIHRNMRTYSSGMGARLRFAINAAAKPEILLIDEALGTGDAAFAAKSRKVVQGIVGGAGTIMLVSHSASTIREMCDRALWLHHGALVADGPADKIAEEYKEWAHHVVRGRPERAEEMMKKRISKFDSPEVILSGTAR